jgi:hypothetical protein
MQRGILAAVCVLVIGVYVYMAQSPIYEPWKSLTPHAARAQYSLLVQGFRTGQLHLCFGVTRALILFWPSVVLTGHYVSHREAAVILRAIGFLASVGVPCALWRRYVSEVSVWVVSLGAIAWAASRSVTSLMLNDDRPVKP